MSASRRFVRRLVAPVSALTTSLMAVFCAALTGIMAGGETERDGGESRAD